MALKTVTSNSIHNSSGTQNSLARNSVQQHRRRDVTAQFRNLLQPVREKPLVAGGTILTFGAMFASVISIVSATALKFIPILGIPAMTMFAYQIFSNHLARSSTSKPNQQVGRTLLQSNLALEGV